ncbi:MAG: hypothetical protein GC136_11305 [Alphaproteobacteria bacterium]|nr:hypothetical protein [Alphaproteobacteria bacterium]
MSDQYSLKHFLRQAPNDLLAQYFENQRIKTDLDISDLKETKIEPLAELVENLSDKQRKQVESDFVSIFYLANQAGYMALRQELGSSASKIDGLECLEAAFTCYLRFYKQFEAALIFQPYFDQDRYWRKVAGLPGTMPENPKQKIKQLEQALSEHFQFEGRGRNCKVEYYNRDTRHFFFAFPEDYPARFVYWKDKQFEREVIHPALEVVFVYDDEAKSLDTHFRGDAKNARKIDNIFGTTILGKPVPAALYDKPIYDLNKLKSRRFKFIYGPKDKVERFLIRKLRLNPRYDRHTQVTVTTNVLGDLGQDALFTQLDKLFAMSGNPQDRIPYDQLEVSAAEISVDFKTETKRGYKRHRFNLSAPNSCSLKHDGDDLIIRKILKASGIEQEPEPVAEEKSSRQAA